MRIKLCYFIIVAASLLLFSCGTDRPDGTETEKPPADSGYSGLFANLKPGTAAHVLLLGLSDKDGGYTTICLARDGDTITPQSRSYIVSPRESGWLLAGTERFDTTVSCKDEPGQAIVIINERHWQTTVPATVLTLRSRLADSLQRMVRTLAKKNNCAGTRGDISVEKITYLHRGTVALRQTSFAHVESNSSFADTLYYLSDQDGRPKDNSLDVFCGNECTAKVTAAVRSKLGAALAGMEQDGCAADSALVIARACSKNALRVRGWNHSKGVLKAVAGVNTQPYLTDMLGYTSQYVCAVVVEQEFFTGGSDTVCAVDWERAKNIHYFLKDVFVSPGQHTVFFLTTEELIGVDVKTGKQLLKMKVPESRVVMAEWVQPMKAADKNNGFGSLPR